MASILKVDTIQDQDGNNIINESGDTITIGASGDTITVPTGASLTVPNGGLSGQNYPAFGARGTSDQAVSATTFTQLTFPTEEFDIGGCYASNTFTVPSGKAGKYFFSVQAEAKNYDATFNIYWVKNGTRDDQHKLTINLVNASDDPGLCMTALFDLSDGDTVSVETYLTSAGDVRYKWFQGFRIGD